MDVVASASTGSPSPGNDKVGEDNGHLWGKSLSKYLFLSGMIDHSSILTEADYEQLKGE